MLLRETLQSFVVKGVKRMSEVEELAILIHQASKLGFNIVDLYSPDDELLAFTCSKSEKYIEAISKIGENSELLQE